MLLQKKYTSGIWKFETWLLVLLLPSLSFCLPKISVLGKDGWLTNANEIEFYLGRVEQTTCYCTQGKEDPPRIRVKKGDFEEILPPFSRGAWGGSRGLQTRPSATHRVEIDLLRSGKPFPITSENLGWGIIAF